MLDQWPFWIAYFGTGALLVLLAWLGGRRRRLSPKQLAAGRHPAACGSCGYDLTGLPGNTCPECGSDLELVGRLSPQFYRWAAVPVTARVIVWTVAVAALGGAFFYVAAESSLPRRQNFRASAQWHISAPIPGEAGNPPYIPLVVSVTAWFTRDLWPGDWIIDDVSPVLPSDTTRWNGASVEAAATTAPTRSGNRFIGQASTAGLVYIEPGPGSAPRKMPLSVAVADAPDGSAGGGDTRAAVIQALSQTAYAGEHGSVEALAEAIVPDLESFLRYGALAGPSRASPWNFGRVSMLQVPSAGMEMWAVLGVSGFWFVVWLAGLPFILHRRPLTIRRENTVGAAL